MCLALNKLAFKYLMCKNIEKYCEIIAIIEAEPAK